MKTFTLKCNKTYQREDLLPSSSRSLSYWVHNTTIQQHPNWTKHIWRIAILVLPNFWKLVITWLSSNLVSNVIHTAKANWYWKAKTPILPLFVLSSIIWASRYLTSLILLYNLLMYILYIPNSMTTWNLVSLLNMLQLKSIVISIKKT